MLIPDAGRGDLPGIVANDVAWIAWVTRGVIPDAVFGGPRDRLLLAERSWQRLAIAAGWPRSTRRLPSGPWLQPCRCRRQVHHILALIADTLPAQAPKSVSDYSSQATLYRSTSATNTLNDPFAVGDDAELFLNRLLRELEIAAESLDRRVFIAELILPAYQQGLAMHLVRGGIPVKIFGNGWDAVAARPECAILEKAWAGPLHSTAELRAAVSAAAGLVHTWPSRSTHPIHRYGKPLLIHSLSEVAFIRDANRILRGGNPTAPVATSPLKLSDLIEKQQRHSRRRRPRFFVFS